MKSILEIYRDYKIMPQLAEHQLRVSAVANLICEKFDGEIDSENIIKACLLHDMGNIVKFTFGPESKYLLPETEVGRLDYWQRVKDDFRGEYGSTSHEATMNILKELEVSPRIAELVECVGFDQAGDNVVSADFGKKICAYSDMRVGPFGVISLEERFADLRQRYQNHPEGAKTRDVFEAALRQIEQQIFSRCSLRPDDINLKIVGVKIEALKFIQI